MVMLIIIIVIIIIVRIRNNNKTGLDSRPVLRPCLVGLALSRLPSEPPPRRTISILRKRVTIAITVAIVVI